MVGGKSRQGLPPLRRRNSDHATQRFSSPVRAWPQGAASHLLVYFPFPSTTIRDGRKYDQPTFQPDSLKKLDTNARGLP